MGKKISLNILIPLCCVVLLGLYAVDTNKLSTTQAELASTQTELTTTQADLALSKANLETTQVQLSQTQTGLENTKNELTSNSQQLDETTSRLDETTSQLDETTSQLTQAKTEYNDTLAFLTQEKTISSQLQSTVDNLQANVKSLTTGYGYVLNDPTYAQVKAFIAADKTDLNAYIENTYVCEDFAYNVLTHALQQNIRCAFVSIRYPDSAHAIVAFNTTDRGLIFIEPQSDEEVNLVAGKHFWQCIVVAPGYYYSPPNYDDTIVRFNVIW